MIISNIKNKLITNKFYIKSINNIFFNDKYNVVKDNLRNDRRTCFFKFCTLLEVFLKL